jgi:hypothetical protein
LKAPKSRQGPKKPARPNAGKAKKAGNPTKKTFARAILRGAPLLPAPSLLAPLCRRDKTSSTL